MYKGTAYDNTVFKTEQLAMLRGEVYKLHIRKLSLTIFDPDGLRKDIKLALEPKGNISIIDSIPLKKWLDIDMKKRRK